MSQSYGDWTEEEQDAWEFVAGDEACERCQALDGSQWDEPPSLPHQYCNCEITPAHPHGDDPWGNLDDCGNSWAAPTSRSTSKNTGPQTTRASNGKLRSPSNATMGPAESIGFGWTAAEIRLTRLHLIGARHIWDNAYDQAEEIMSQVCQCSEELIR